MTTLEHDRAGTAAPARRRRTSDRWAYGIAAAVLTAAVALRFEALAADALHADYGIQFHLSRLTAEGAVPIRDFEHGWNALGWVVGGALYRLVGGSATWWMFGWLHVTAQLLAGLAVLAVGWRLRLRGGWVLGLFVTWMWLTTVVNGKYAIPSLWLLALLPVGALASRYGAVAVRVVLAALTFWAHVDLAVMLTGGVVLYDLLGERALGSRDRLLRAAAAPAGLVVALVLQVLVYQRLGVSPGDLVAFLLVARSGTVEGTNFGYPLFAPGDLRTLVYPLSLLVPLVPLVWRRLSDPTRLAVLLHLGMSLTAIRKPDAPHIAAAATLLAVVIVLGARDVLAAASVRGRRRLALPPVAVGAVWFAAALGVGFGWDHLLAAAGLVALGLLGPLAARGGEQPGMSLGALGVAGAVAVGGVVGHVASELPATQDDGEARAIADELAPHVRSCLGGDRRAWVVSEPLGLYEHLDIDNPTPFYLFWGFQQETERVVTMMDDGRIPAIIQVNDWAPVAFDDIAPAVEARYDRCAEVPVAATGDRVTIWVHERGPAAR